MISYDPFWDTIKEKGISTYTIATTYRVSYNTLQRMRDGESLSLRTIDTLCRMLKVPIEKVVKIEW